MNHPQKAAYKTLKTVFITRLHLTGWSDGSLIDVISSPDKHTHSRLSVVGLHVPVLSWQKLLSRSWSLVQRIKEAHDGTSTNTSLRLWILSGCQLQYGSLVSPKGAPRGPFLFRVSCLGVYLAARSVFSPISVCRCRDDTQTAAHKSLLEKEGTVMPASRLLWCVSYILS